MKTRAQRELDAWGWYVDRLADLAVAFKLKQQITEEEFKQMGAYYVWMWQSHGVV